MKHINAAGPHVKVKLVTKWGEPVQVEITRERLRELDLKREVRAYLSPKGENAFAYSIP